MKAEREKLIGERYKLLAEPEKLMAERDKMVAQGDLQPSWRNWVYSPLPELVRTVSAHQRSPLFPNRLNAFVTAHVRRWMC